MDWPRLLWAAFFILAGTAAFRAARRDAERAARFFKLGPESQRRYFISYRVLSVFFVLLGLSILLGIVVVDEGQLRLRTAEDASPNRLCAALDSTPSEGNPAN